MAFRPVHHHACVGQCGLKLPCDGSWERNEDGFPEVICANYHIAGGTLNESFLCDPCKAKQQADQEAE